MNPMHREGYAGTFFKMMMIIFGRPNISLSRLASAGPYWLLHASDKARLFIAGARQRLPCLVFAPHL
jgi:hypothetical protein